jgi:hypothetical protein
MTLIGGERNGSKDRPKSPIILFHLQSMQFSFWNTYNTTCQLAKTLLPP